MTLAIFLILIAVSSTSIKLPRTGALIAVVFVAVAVAVVRASRI